MTRTSSRRRSRSDAEPGRTAAPAPPDASGRPTATALGAKAPGTVRIVACSGDEATKTDDLAQLAALIASPQHRVWVDLASPDDDQVKAAADALGLHPLIAEDIRERNQRSKIETFDEDVVHLVLFALHYEGEAAADEIDFVLGKGYLLTVHDSAIGDSTAAPLRFGVEHALRKGPDYLLYAIADTIADGYFPVLDRIGDDIDGLQDRVMQQASDWTLQRLFALKRELIGLRRATSPAREIFAQLTNREVAAIDPTHIVYFRDVYDHLIRVTDELDNYRDLVSGTLDIYVSIVNNDLSRIMKRLTGVTVILAGIGAVAGVFGMSEAGAAFNGAEAGGFWLVTAGVVLLALAAAAVLRRFDWI
ncbi:MAG TPA: magnesium transporter CorA family protein [Candidatus Limnocylindrales bacterium]|nr:magnesium transporter CorA family protein [Candidatus Limnocylindrales bacterium]